jgi:hypothetical protein
MQCSSSAFFILCIVANPPWADFKIHACHSERNEEPRRAREVPWKESL